MSAPELTVIIVSYNTRELTLEAVRTLYQTTVKTPFHCIVLDNASEDGSADAIADAFPQVELIRSDENLGFAEGNNIAARRTNSEWLLLLNPDTECYKGAVDNLIAFSRAHPKAGITGGRTVYRDGSLNASSCWNKPTLWSLFCQATGLTAALRNIELFNPEGMGGWRRDTIREVDIVVGCFLMIKRSLWEELGGFQTRYFMYGEESDLCLRAKKMGYQPMITPDAQIMHIVGASTGDRPLRKRLLVHKARATLIRDHWSQPAASLGVFIMKSGVGLRLLVSRLSGRGQETWSEVWQARRDWSAGY